MAVLGLGGIRGIRVDRGWGMVVEGEVVEGIREEWGGDRGGICIWVVMLVLRGVLGGINLCRGGGLMGVLMGVRVVGRRRGIVLLCELYRLATKS